MEFDVTFNEDSAFDTYYSEFYASQNDYEKLRNLPSLNSQEIIGDLTAADYGFGTVYPYNVGNESGNVPVVGQNGKLSTAIIPTLNYVTSVNTKTGTVVLTNTDVGALSSSTDYIASASVNGNILTVTNSDGISFNSGDTTYSTATTTTSGLMSSTDKTKLDGIESGAQVNTVTSVNSKTGAVSLTYTDVNALSNTTSLTDLSGTLAILHGGTGATTESEALTNLGAQASTDNSLTTTSKTVTGAINELHSTIGTLNDSLEGTLNGN